MTTVIPKAVVASAASSSSSARRVLVAGAGIIGLRTAIELSRRGIAKQIVLRAPHHPVQQSCSVGAGGYWMPFHCHDPRVDQWALETLDEMIALAAHNQRESSTQLPLVEMVPAIILRREKAATLPTWTQRDGRLQFQELTVEMLSWQNTVHRLKIPPLLELKEAGYEHAWFFQSAIANTANMLQSYLTELETQHQADINVESGTTFTSLDHLRETAHELECDVVVNCTGMGSREMVPDPELIPSRGVLLHYDRSQCMRRPEVMSPNENNDNNHNIHDAVLTCTEEPWGSDAYPAYLIPRGSTIIVGGTCLNGDEEVGIRSKERKQILANAHRLGIDTQSCVVQGEWVGFRPYRSTVRCEWEMPLQSQSHQNQNRPIFHSYGYGGSGWTVCVGAAKECANQILELYQKNEANS